ncbi:MAG: Enolase [candidate division WS2 bacterium ADurb.Bin280]|uniref:Enolase n=1 Tax=candidate division WS2 bacterium ADurb.Bin280 TaxID=1852829 RepID=A0A1V5SBE8_9BACT|nr:MAG: Enolase [candidate division WS2 bacterium ADurb.Bin280]
MEKIVRIIAREILDSRGDPTVEVELETENSIRSIASAPSGASVGSNEAVELRDNDQNRYSGLGVTKAIESIRNTIGPALTGFDVEDQRGVDETMASLDGTTHKSKLGANAILAVSLAACKAGAVSKKIPLYQHIAQLAGNNQPTLPTPMFNFIEGAKHADNNLAIQEFLVLTKADTFKERLRIGSELFHNLKKIIKNRGLDVAVGHEGGFAPNLSGDEEALKLLVESGAQELGLDMAGVTPNGLTLDYIISNYPMATIEDPIEETNWEEWAQVTEKFASSHLIIGDDIFCTNTDRLKQGIEKKTANAVIVKPNQVGTVSQTLDFVALAKQNNYQLVASHRSGETEDTFISDFAVGIGAQYAKFGAPSRGERVAKYNRLLRIEEEIIG